MVFKNLCVIVLWIKVASALEGLTYCCFNSFMLDIVILMTIISATVNSPLFGDTLLIIRFSWVRGWPMFYENTDKAE